MLDMIRRYVEAGREALSSERAQELARELIKQGQARGAELQKVAGDVLEWSRRNSERFLEIVRREVKKQMSALGVATTDDVAALRKRVRDLERTSGGRATSSRSKTSTSKSARSKTSASKSSRSPSTSSRSGSTAKDPGKPASE